YVTNHAPRPIAPTSSSAARDRKPITAKRPQLHHRHTAPVPIPPPYPSQAADAALLAEETLCFIPDPKQRELLQSTSKHGILNCTRQWGNSTTCAITALHYAYFHPDSLVLVAAPTLRQCGEFIRKARVAVSRLGITP